ncbi:4'-phosphopantetheinyl transferase [Streptomyces koyangensis]|uniref:4'-phosphopantetheinyl transferase family protein n=1 Tax=Streptomyces koyangensis TaxID=188770 RepID=UPI003649A824
MIGELLPDAVIVVASHGGADDGLVVLPEEEAAVAGAVAKRRHEFAAVRACARQAMEKLGFPAQPVVPGEHGAPRWPEGLLGSMTHCDGYRAAAIARATDLASLGIDAEPHGPLPKGVLDVVSLPAERQRLAFLASVQPGIHWDRLLFSAKESVYKAWFPLMRKMLGFEEADIEIHQDPGPTPRGRFRAQLLVPGPLVGGRRVGHFEGRWTVRENLVATALTVPHS